MNWSLLLHLHLSETSFSKSHNTNNDKFNVVHCTSTGFLSCHMIGDIQLPVASYQKMIEQATQFVLACYQISDKKTMTEARVHAWKSKMRKNTLEVPKLCSLPPTSEAFGQNVLRAYHQTELWLNSLKSDPPSINPTDHGWTRIDGSTMLIPTIVPNDIPLAPKELLKVIKCGCDNKHPCATNRCGCRSQDLRCTLFLCVQRRRCLSKQNFC